MLNARARRHHWEGVGLASVKSFSGQAVYHLEQGRVTVGSGSYLLLNDGEPYRIDIDGAQELESFCIVFSTGSLERARFSREHSPEAALDQPEGRAHPVQLMNLPRPHDDVLSPVLREFQRRYRFLADDPLFVAGEIERVLSAVLDVHHIASAETAHLSALKPSTREELYRRLSLARDYLFAHFRERITIDTLGRVSALSENRLIQHYREAFGITPHQEVRRRRIECALMRLGQGEGGDVPLTTLALDCGYQTPGAFSTAFRIHTGLAPSAFRRAHGRTARKSGRTPPSE